MDRKFGLGDRVRRLNPTALEAEWGKVATGRVLELEERRDGRDYVRVAWDVNRPKYSPRETTLNADNLILVEAAPRSNPDA